MVKLAIAPDKALAARVDLILESLWAPERKKNMKKTLGILILSFTVGARGQSFCLPRMGLPPSVLQAGPRDPHRPFAFRLNPNGLQKFTQNFSRRNRLMNRPAARRVPCGVAEFPRLGLSGNYFYQTYVPELSIVPNAPKEPFGEANNWSAWATLNWNLWDFRSQHNLANSATAGSQSQEQQYLAAQRQLRSAVRLAYFQAKIDLEQVHLLGDSLKVAQAQYADIGHQARYGTASRLDSLSSHQEVLGYQRQFVQAQANLAQSLRDLFDLTGMKEPADLTRPLDNHMEGNCPKAWRFPRFGFPRIRSGT